MPAYNPFRPYTICFASLTLSVLSLCASALAQTTATSSSPTVSVTTVNFAANSLAWDPVSQQIFLTVPGAGGSVQALNPTTGALGTSVSAAGSPNLIAVSANSQYLYVGLDASAAVQRFTLPNLAADIQIPLGSVSSSASPYSGTNFASDLQASPVTDGTIAVVKSTVTGLGNPTETGGVVIYDNATPRSNSLCGFELFSCPNSNNEFARIRWNANGSKMFAYSFASPDFFNIPVTSAGFGSFNLFYDLIADVGMYIHFDRVTGYVFTDTGGILDLNVGAPIGTLGTPVSLPVPNGGLLVPDGSLGTAFFLIGGELTGNTYTLTSYDIQRLTPIASVTISNVVGVPTHFIRWGTNGLAFTTTSSSFSTGSAVYVLSGSFVAPPPKALPTITSSGTVPLYSAVNTVHL